MRRPSQKSIDIYNQLVEKQNQVRKILTRIHKKHEEASGAGRLPALIIPKKAKKIKPSHFYERDKTLLKARIRAFWRSYNVAKALFGRGLTSYLARTVKDGYMELWRDQILFMSGESPQGVANKFTREQMEKSYLGEFMHTYNRLMQLSPEEFLTMLYKGEIIQFKHIYAEMTGIGNKEYSWLDQQNDALNIFRSAKARKDLLLQTEQELKEANKKENKKGRYRGNVKEETYDEAEELRARREKK